MPAANFSVPEKLTSGSVSRSKAVASIRVAMEAVLLLMVSAAPWAYGAVHPGFEFLLDVGVALLLALWGVRMLLEGELSWRKSPVALCLAGLFLIGVWQIMPLPRPVLLWVAPATARTYEQLLPAQPEELPGREKTAPAN